MLIRYIEQIKHGGHIFFLKFLCGHVLETCFNDIVIIGFCHVCNPEVDTKYGIQNLADEYQQEYI